MLSKPNFPATSIHFTNILEKINSVSRWKFRSNFRWKTQTVGKDTQVAPQRNRCLVISQRDLNMSLKYVEEPIVGVTRPHHPTPGEGTDTQPNGVTPAGKRQWGDVHNSCGRSFGAGTVMTGWPLLCNWGLTTPYVTDPHAKPGPRFEQAVRGYTTTHTHPRSHLGPPPLSPSPPLWPSITAPSSSSPPGLRSPTTICLLEGQYFFLFAGPTPSWKLL